MVLQPHSAPQPTLAAADGKGKKPKYDIPEIAHLPPGVQPWPAIKTLEQFYDAYYKGSKHLPPLRYLENKYEWRWRAGHRQRWHDVSVLVDMVEDTAKVRGCSDWEAVQFWANKQKTDSKYDSLDKLRTFYSTFGATDTFKRCVAPERPPDYKSPAKPARRQAGTTQGAAAPAAAPAAAGPSAAGPSAAGPSAAGAPGVSPEAAGVVRGGPGTAGDNERGSRGGAAAASSQGEGGGNGVGGKAGGDAGAGGGSDGMAGRAVGPEQPSAQGPLQSAQAQQGQAAAAGSGQSFGGVDMNAVLVLAAAAQQLAQRLQVAGVGSAGGSGSAGGQLAAGAPSSAAGVKKSKARSRKAPQGAVAGGEGRICGFTLFVQEESAKEKAAGGAPPGETSQGRFKRLAGMWKLLSVEARAQYKQRAEAKNAAQC